MSQGEAEKRLDLLPPDALKGKRLGLSVSDSPDLKRLGLRDTHFRMTLGELARVVIVAGGSLYYGGHLRPDGITTFLIEELHRYGRRDRPLKVCLAWTVHRGMSAEEIRDQKEFLGLFGEVLFLDIDGKLLPERPDEPQQTEFSTEERAQALSGLRSFLSDNTSARIVIGGKRTGYEGVMPGIVEEVLGALEHRQPLYLAGGFGGATQDIVRTLHPELAEWLPPLEDADVLDEGLQRGLEILHDHSQKSGWNGYENGLSDEENALLAASYRPSEIAALVGRGLGRLLIDEQA